MQCHFQLHLLFSFPLQGGWHWSFSKTQLQTQQTFFKKKNSDMAPKLQSKTLETKAQSCPPSAEFPVEAAAESSGEDVPDRMVSISFRDCKNTALKSF